MPASLLAPILPKLIDVGAGLIKSFFPDPEDQRKAELEMMKWSQRLAEGQLDVNRIEAAHRSVWVAGWRPAVGWVCAAALGYAYIVRDLIAYGAAIAGVELAHPLPELELGGLMPLLLGMLGLGGLRTYEKFKGVAR